MTMFHSRLGANPEISDGLMVGLDELHGFFPTLMILYYDSVQKCEISEILKYNILLH